MWNYRITHWYTIRYVYQVWLCPQIRSLKSLTTLKTLRTLRSFAGKAKPIRNEKKSKNPSQLKKSLYLCSMMVMNGKHPALNVLHAASGCENRSVGHSADCVSASGVRNGVCANLAQTVTCCLSGIYPPPERIDTLNSTFHFTR